MNASSAIPGGIDLGLPYGALRPEHRRPMRVVGKRDPRSDAAAVGAYALWSDQVDAGDRPDDDVVRAAAAEVVLAWELDDDRVVPLDPSDLGDALQILAAQRRRDAVDIAVACLSPAARAVHLCLPSALHPFVDEIAARLRSDSPHALIVVRMPRHEWYPPLEAAVAAWLVEAACNVGRECLAPRLVHPRAESYGRGQHHFDVENVLGEARKRSVVAAYQGSESVPDALLAFADAVIDLSAAINCDVLAGVVARKLGERPEWPENLHAEKFRPELFEAALARAVRADDVHRVVAEVAGLEALRAAEREADRIAKEAVKEAARNAEKAAAAAPGVLRPSSPKLGDLYGYGAAATWGEALAVDIADYRAGVIPWSDVDAGCLLSGPPGTGKTLFASALAASCDVAFIPTSFKEWSGEKGWGLDDVISGMSRVFKAANEAAPCILFIDEIDAVPARGSSSKSGESYWTPIVTALLEALDGTARREGVVAVAACNHPDKLDPALVRSGRLDRRFEIALPDEKALVGILGHHLPGIDAAVLSPVATTLAGTTSGADAARIAREAQRIARQAQRDVSGDDLLAVAMPADMRPAELRRRVAIHEAGHAVAMIVGGRMPASLSLVQAAGMGGSVRLERAESLTLLGDLEAEVVFLLAGRAAEDVCLGEASVGAGAGTGSDLDVATRLLSTSQTVGLGGYLISGRQADGVYVEERLRRLYAETMLLIARHRAAVEALAALALEQRVLPRAALAAFAAEHGLDGR